MIVTEEPWSRARLLFLCISHSQTEAGGWVDSSDVTLEADGFALKVIMILGSPGKYIRRIILMSLESLWAIMTVSSALKATGFSFLFNTVEFPKWHTNIHGTKPQPITQFCSCITSMLQKNCTILYCTKTYDLKSTFYTTLWTAK